VGTPRAINENTINTTKKQGTKMDDNQAINTTEKPI
jgi:hypothetical protein